jgi:hypothetical protein
MAAPVPLCRENVVDVLRARGSELNRFDEATSASDLCGR